MIHLICVIFFSINCDSLESKLYTFGGSIQQVRKCACVRRSDFKKLVCENSKLLSESSKCAELKPAVDSLKREIKTVKKTLN